MAYTLTFFEVGQSPPTSGARSWDPRLPEEKKKEEEATLIASRDPHLAGGEMQTFHKWYTWTWSERQVNTISMILCSQIIAL